MPRNNAACAVVAARRARVWELRLGGQTMRAIADDVGSSVATVCRDIAAMLAEVNEATRETVAEMRALEAERLDAMTAALWTKVEAGELRAIDMMLRVMNRRARLFGLDAPKAAVAVETDGPITVRWGSDPPLPRIPLANAEGERRRGAVPTAPARSDPERDGATPAPGLAALLGGGVDRAPAPQ